MKLNSDLLNEVIADAKAVRETAVQTAISRLKETFEPTVRNLISQKLREEDGEEDPMDDTAPVAPPAPESSEEDAVAPVAPAPEEETMEEELEFDVDGYTDDTYEDDDIFEEDYLDNGESDDDFLAQILAELDDETSEDPMMSEEDVYSDEMTEEDEMMSDDEISEEDLDEMISELEDSMATEEEDMESKPTMESRRRNGKKLRESWVNNWGDDEYDAQNDYARDNQIVNENRKLKSQLRKANSQLKEAYQAINTQKSAIKEVNLLNSKLLFLTKITSKHQLTPEKQIKVLEAFDRAKTVREVKLIYSTIAESLSKSKSVKGIMESASRPARVVKKSLNEQYDFAKRWQELAGIAK
jgi:hypothetical protein